MRTDIKNICNKCKKRQTCKVPCYPIQEYLKRDNLPVYEKRDEKSITVYARSRETQESMLSTGVD